MVKARLILLAIRVVVIMIVIGAMILYAIILTSSTNTACQLNDQSLSPGAAPQTIDDVTLDTEQARTAHQIAAVVNERVPALLRPNALVIALMTAMTEASLRNPPGGHLDSVGAFQQRGRGWGTKAQRSDVRTATAAFLGGPAPPAAPGLLDLPRWHELPPWAAAQAVQRSAYPDGANYRRWHPFATRLAGTLTTNSDALRACPSPSADGAAPSLPGDIPSQARTAITWALKQLGTPYVWGGRCEDPRLKPTDPLRQNCDCSSLTMQAYRQAGIILPRTSQQQVGVGTPVPTSQARAGDLVFSEPDAAGRPGHVTLHIGNGQLISAPGRGKVVRLVKWRTYLKSVIAVRRPT